MKMKQETNTAVETIEIDDDDEVFWHSMHIRSKIRDDTGYLRSDAALPPKSRMAQHVTGRCELTLTCNHCPDLCSQQEQDQGAATGLPAAGAGQQSGS